MSDLGGIQSPVLSFVSLLGLALLPVLFMAMSSYLKISIVLSVLRNAIGGGQIPSQAICGIIALMLSVFTMLPVAENSFLEFPSIDNVKKELSAIQNKEPNEVLESLKHTFGKSVGPLLGFLRSNAALEQRLIMHQLRLAQKRTELESPNLVPVAGACVEDNEELLRDCLDKNESGLGLILAFMLSELKVAFEIGVCIFIPFVLIDLIVSTLLTGLGMMMVSPVSITLPLKLLLFALADGWSILLESLVYSYILPG